MGRIIRISLVLGVLFIYGGPLLSTAHAGDPAFSKRIVVFHEEVPWKEIRQYGQQWEQFGVSVVMELPFIHGLILKAPVSISSAELAADPRVVSVESNQKVQIQAVSATADGGAADGGAADGGAADGGAADGGAADGGAADGGAADGGAADGGAADGGAADGGAADGGAADGGAADGGAADGGAQDSMPSWSVIRPVAKPLEDTRPWGILKLYEQLRTPGLLTDQFDPYDTPWEIRLALRRMRRKQIRVAILDTGVDVTHPSLAGKVKGGFDVFSMSPGLPRDDNGHGTHIAGTLCGRLDDDPFGLTPRVAIYSVKILDKYATGDLVNIIIGLKWVIDNDIDVVNMSIGYREDSQAMRLAIKKAYESGVILVAAVGNHSTWDAPAPVAAADGGAADGGAADGGAADGGAADGGAADGGAADGGAADGGAADGGAADGGAADGGAADGGAADGGAADGGAADGGAADGGAADGGAADGGAADGGAADGGAADGGAADGGAADGTEGDLPWYSVMYPARYPEVIAVGASTPYGEMAEFSNSGKELDLTAPGTDIVSTNVWKWGGFGVSSGTSMATPHVAGAVAMMLAIDPKLSAKEIHGILKETANELEYSPGIADLNLTGALKEVYIRVLKKAWRTRWVRRRHWRCW